jgi:hypothetical protein
MVVSGDMFGFVLKLSGILTNSIDLFAIVAYTSTSPFSSGSMDGIICSALQPVKEVLRK